MGFIYEVYVRLKNSEEKQKVTILIDTGSPSNLITAALAERVNLENNTHLDQDSVSLEIRDAFDGTNLGKGSCSFDIYFKIYPNVSDPAVEKRYAARADIVPNLNPNPTVLDPSYDILIGADFLQANYLGIDFCVPKSVPHSDGVLDSIISRPNYNRVRLFEKISHQGRDYFAMATTLTKESDKFSTLETLEKGVLLEVSGEKGSKILNVGLNNDLPYSIMTSAAVENVGELRLNLDPATLYDDEKDLHFEVWVTRDRQEKSEFRTRLKVKIMNNTVICIPFIVKDLPQDFDLIFGMDIIESYGLDKRNGELVVHNPIRRM